MKPNKDVILLYMARKGLSRQDIIDASDLPPRTLADVMAGKSTRPKTLGKVAKALGVDPSELLVREDSHE